MGKAESEGREETEEDTEMMSKGNEGEETEEREDREREEKEEEEETEKGKSKDKEGVKLEERVEMLDREKEREREEGVRRRRRDADVAFVCSVIGQLGDTELVLEILSPSICRELENSLSAEETKKFLFLIAVCCQKIEKKVGSPKNLPEELKNILPSILSEYCIQIFQTVGNGNEEESKNGEGMSYRTEREVRTCVAIMLTSPSLLSPFLNNLVKPEREDGGERRGEEEEGEEEGRKGVGKGGGVEGEKRERRIVSSMSTLRNLCDYKPLEKHLLSLEEKVKTVLSSFQGNIESDDNKKNKSGYKSKGLKEYNRLYGRLSLLYGWKVEEKEK